MKINEINKIEVLRSELKKRMVKCIRTYEKNGDIFNEGEYYDYYQDNCEDFQVIGDKNEVEIDYNYFRFYEDK